MTGVPREETLAADRAWAFEAVPSVSRTFALSVELLDEPMASWICTGYLLCRTADTVEDEPTIEPRRRADLLDTFDAALDPDDPTSVEDFRTAALEHRPDDGGGPDWAVVADVERTFRLYRSFDDEVQRAMREITREMATGMATVLRRHADHGGLRLETVEELEEYCWYVAGTVGELFTRLRACLDVETRAPDDEDARSFALLLQLVNIAKDVRADWEEENNVYLPGEWLAAEGIDHAAVADPEDTSAVARVVERVVDRAEGYAEGARGYLATISGRESGLLEATALPYLLALGTIRELRGRTTDAVAQPDAVKLDRAEVVALMAEMEAGISQADVDAIADVVRAGPYHE